LTCRRTVAENVAILRTAGAPCSELNSVDQMIGHAQVQASQILQPITLADGVAHSVVALPVRIDGSRGTRFQQPPLLGADSNRILSEIGYDAARVQKLRDGGVVG
jgi:crotonobetainyl-CoA:carnitine CoA-transferase CaiB-like acyl-CoA transferase